MEDKSVSEDTNNFEVTSAGELNRMIQKEIKSIYRNLERARAQTKFSSFSSVNTPMVLVLGNHSSGKSSFINYMLQQDVQKTGRAPTDSTFTVIAGGDRAERLDGHALCRSSKYGFIDLPSLFGRSFVSQLELKVIEKCKLLDDSGIILVDSPGMIDPPGTAASRSDKDRGYDFKSVVRWFADRADVILVMFDPDKPGTTFETLDVLTSCLQDVSSKVQLILNKVDDFDSVHDFARAYGALCWNLSKVIPRKDIPFIYTMYIPQDDGVKVSEVSLKHPELDEGKKEKRLSPLKQLLTEEFDGTREEVIVEVKRAPDRSTDSILSDLNNTCSRFQMHCRLLEACKNEYLELEQFWKYATMAIGALGITAAAVYVIRNTAHSAPTSRTSELIATSSSSSSTSISESRSSEKLSVPGAKGTAVSSPNAAPKWKEDWNKRVSKAHNPFRWMTLFKIVASSAASTLLSYRYSQLRLERKQDTVLDWLPDVFRREYHDFLSKSDRSHDAILERWAHTRPILELALSSFSLKELPVLNAQDQTYLDDVLNIDIPRLNRSVRDRQGDDHAYLAFKHRDRPSAGVNAKQKSD